MSDTLVIDKFKGEYEFLSNSFVCFFEYNGKQFSNVESAFQSTKCVSESDVDQFTVDGKYNRASPAKKVASSMEVRDGWEQEADNLMLSILRRKFSIAEFEIRLLLTGDSKIIYTNKENDIYFGVCNGIGENKLGQLLMQVRAELREQKQSNLHYREEADELVTQLTSALGNYDDVATWRFLYTTTYECFWRYCFYLTGLQGDNSRFDSRVHLASCMLLYPEIRDSLSWKESSHLIDMCIQLDYNECNTSFDFLLSCLDVLDCIRNLVENKL